MHTRGSYLSELVSEITSLKVHYVKIKGFNTEVDVDPKIGDSANEAYALRVSPEYIDSFHKKTPFNLYFNRLTILIEQVLCEIFSTRDKDQILSLLAIINSYNTRLEAAVEISEDCLYLHRTNKVDRDKLTELNNCLYFIFEYEDRNLVIDGNPFDSLNDYNFLVQVSDILLIHSSRIGDLLIKIINGLTGDNYSEKKKLLDIYCLPYSGVLRVNSKFSNYEAIESGLSLSFLKAADINNNISPTDSLTSKEVALFYFYMGIDNSEFSIDKNNCAEIARTYNFIATNSGKSLLRDFRNIIKPLERAGTCTGKKNYNSQIESFKIVLDKIKKEGSEKAYKFAFKEYTDFKDAYQDFY